MFKVCTGLSIALLYQCVVINIVASSEKPLNNYDVVEGLQSFNKVNLTVETFALLVEDNLQNFNKVLSFVQTVLPDNQYENRDYWLITLNATGASPVLVKSNGDINEFSRKIEARIAQNNFKSKEYLDPQYVMSSVIATAISMPIQSAIVLFTNTYFIPRDENAKNITWRNIINKNVLVYGINNSELSLHTIIKNCFPDEKNLTLTTEEHKYELYRQDPHNQTTEQNESTILTSHNIINANNLSFQQNVSTKKEKHEPYRLDLQNQTSKQNESTLFTSQNIINANNRSFQYTMSIAGPKYDFYREYPHNQTTEKIMSGNLTHQNIINGNNLSFQPDMSTTERKYELYKQDPYHQSTEQNVSVILTRKNLINAINLSFPIDQDVTGLHILISPSKTTEAILISPNGYTFSFSRNAKAINIKYSPDSFFDNQHGFFELHLNFSTAARSNIGMWQLKLENLMDFYNVSVFAFTSIAAEATIHLSNTGQNEYEITKDVMKLGVTGNISQITDISVLDRNGETLLSNISYKFNDNRLNYVTENIDNVPDARNKEVDVEFNRLQNTQPVYALIKGKDVKGNIFQRLGYILGLGRSAIYPQQFLTVEVGLGSELIATSDKRAEVYFEVTNHASSAQLVTFSCSDNKYILQSLSIYRRYLEPQESTMVTLYLNTKYGSYQDKITFSASSGSLVVQKKVFVDVGSQSQSTDQNKPDIWYKYTSDCTGVIFTSCTKGTWTIEITARDTESGLLQLNTVPKGLYFPNGYTSGTKDFVTGYFSESCCNPRLQISAVDRMNNVRNINVNAYFSRLSPGALAAIILGILLFIILVAVIIFFACRRYKKKKEEYELPTYRGGSI